MRIRQKLYVAISNKTDLLLVLASVLSVFGTVTVLSGGVWDAVSHMLDEPELFWTIQHVVVYAGVGMSAVAGLISWAVLRAGTHAKFAPGVKLLCIGAALQLVSGFGDSVSHDVFGIDGLVSLSHQPLELGLVLVTLGGFVILKNVTSSGNNKNGTRKQLPISIASFIAATSWLGFNLMLLLGGSLMCIPIYEIFSSGCAVL